MQRSGTGSPPRPITARYRPIPDHGAPAERQGGFRRARRCVATAGAEVNALYIKPRVWREVVEVALELGAEMPPSANPLRELDIWLVKYAQEPEPAIGIMRNLDRRMPAHL